MKECVYCLMFFEKEKLNYSCRCKEDHAVCFDCYKKYDVRYRDVQRKFGDWHLVKIEKEVHPKDLENKIDI